jgi:hypothetical protein
MQFPKTTVDTSGTVQSWFEEHEGELQHLPWPAQSPRLNIIEPLRSVLGTRVRNRVPRPKSRKQVEDVLQEEWYKIQVIPQQTGCLHYIRTEDFDLLGYKAV